MASLVCPNCQVQTFTWSYDDEDTPPTSWRCGNCGYFSGEDESFERVCSICGIKTESRLEDDTKIYWWCSSCNNVTLISEN
jgi:ribosomal protein S27AE